jgi:filamin
VLDAADIVENPEEMSIMTYVSYFRDYADTLKHNASPANCTADGPGITGGDARSGDADFTIYSCNKQGKQKDSGGDHFGVKVKDPTGAVMDIQVTDNGNGTYSGTYPTDYPGDYEVDIQLKNEPIQGSVFVARQVLGNPGQSYAEGEGLTGGKTGHPANFTIFAMAEDGKRIGRGGDFFTVTVNGPSGPLEAVVTDAGNGTYPVEYAPTEAGIYDINITLFDEPIKDAPFQATIKLAVDASKSWVEGPGVEKAYKDRPNTFVVHAVDEAGEPVVCEDCEVTLKPKDESSGLPEVPVKVTNNGDGTHSCEYSPEVVGDYVLEVKLDGEDVKDTPKDITIKRAPNAENSWVDGPGVQKALQNRSNPFVVHAMDDDKQPVWGDQCSVTLKPTDESSGLPEVPVTVVDNGDGTYACDYVPTHTGDYVLAVKLEGEDVKDTPMALTVKRAPDASKSWAEGPGLKKAFDNKPAKFKVHARGDDGEPVWGDDCTVTVVPEDPSSGLAEVPAEVTDNGDGTYSVVYHPLEAGNFVVNVQLEGADVKDMPVKVRVREGVSVDKTGRCKFKATIIARNKDGEAHTEGGADWEVSVMGPEETEIPVKATDNGDGSYSAEYKLTADPDAEGPQEYIISMCLNEDHIQGSPFRQFM